MATVIDAYRIMDDNGTEWDVFDGGTTLKLTDAHRKHPDITIDCPDNPADNTFVTLAKAVIEALVKAELIAGHSKDFMQFLYMVRIRIGNYCNDAYQLSIYNVLTVVKKVDPISDLLEYAQMYGMNAAALDAYSRYEYKRGL